VLAGIEGVRMRRRGRAGARAGKVCEHGELLVEDVLIEVVRLEGRRGLGELGVRAASAVSILSGKRVRDEGAPSGKDKAGEP
jgi:hypothetical protein